MINIKWITTLKIALAHKKGLFLISTSTAVAPVIGQWLGYAEYFKYSLYGWIIIMALCFWEYTTYSKSTLQKRQIKKQELFSKFITYTLVISASRVAEEISAPFGDALRLSISVISFFIYAISATGELIIIGTNIEKKYGSKPNVFKLLENLNSLLHKKTIERLVNTKKDAKSDNSNKQE